MNRIPLSIPELGLISGTRAMIGAGAALLLADRLSKDQRRAVGWTLVAIGAITTIPIAIGLYAAHTAADQERPARRGLGRFVGEEQHA